MAGALWLLHAAVIAQPTPSTPPTSAPEDIVVRLIDPTTRHVLARTEIDVFTDNGIRCVRAPCPINAKQWRGTTDEAGVLHVPADVVQQSVIARRAPEGDWVDLRGAERPDRDGLRRVAMPPSPR